MTVASARSLFSIKSLFGDVPFSLPIIEFNGAFITDYSSGEHLRERALAQEVSLRVLDVIRRAGHRPFISSHDGARDRLHYDEIGNRAMHWYESRRRAAGDPRLTRTCRLEQALREKVVSMTVMVDSESAAIELHAELDLQLGSQLTLYRYENAYDRGTWWLTIHDPGARKNLAVQTLKTEYVPDARVIAFGDHHNDLHMVEQADWGLAVENAVGDVKRVAKEVIGHCDADSVIRFIEQHERGRLK